ncbi:HD domain-containing protein [Caminicella sporogenes DSM 14501]|uniref:HD domain-containing protein n=1 Tax=Caminicella sporogenes DSM 14501 TaxID=1121266 RepID=A0A1M6RYT3_9FIRM|nr:HD domain-containing phosphohydrolase [Caminicella sporogenes]RKD27138.1 HD family phosphohydrolase [Caminicella sporogenes]WIF95554.1 HD domain-containing phosphohydrolase [Caminicella sporogenes]SHK37469.1 HD domain-containing protein [Caminicella sporogenes DSM 14501]
MKFNLNKFLFSVSYALDFVEMDILGVSTNHSKRVAYMSAVIGKALNLTEEEVFDLVSLSILHDNGASQNLLDENLNLVDSKTIHRYYLESRKNHCIIGEKNLKAYPFLTDVTGVIKYHHETYSGTGFFGLRNNEIPLMSQIIHFGDTLENSFNLKKSSTKDIEKIYKFISLNKGILFSPIIVDTFLDVSKNISFWLNMRDEFIDYALHEYVPKRTVDLTWKEIKQITDVFSNIIDSKSKFTLRHSRGLTEKVSIMADYYGKNSDEKMKLMIAADLHDLGKLAVNTSILDKPGKLTREEFEIIQKHPYYTRITLRQIEGFREITEWASNHHEKLNGSGYPYGLTEKELDFNSRLMACLDVYQALTEDRPYREKLTHNEGIKILKSMAKDNLLDGYIVEDIDKVMK